MALMLHGYYLQGELERKKRNEKRFKIFSGIVIGATLVYFVIAYIAGLPGTEKRTNIPKYKIYTQDLNGNKLYLNNDVFPDEIVARRGSDLVVHLGSIYEGRFRVLTRETAKDSLDNLVLEKAKEIVETTIPTKVIRD
jgi:hypothetical protein